MFSYGQKKASSSQSSNPIGAGAVGEYYRNAYGWAGDEPAGEYPDFQYDMMGGETGGDYDRLEQQMAATPLRRLSEDYTNQQDQFRARMRKLGMADDPSAMQLEEETLGTPYSRSQADILSNAANQRYQLQSGELKDLNAARTDYAKSAYQSQREYWLAKMDRYYKGMGQTSTGSSSDKSWNFSLGY